MSQLQTWVRLLKAMFRKQTETDRVIAATSPWLGRMSRILGVSPTLLETLADNLTTLQALLSADFAEEFRNRDPYGEFINAFDKRAQLSGREPVHQLLYLWMKSLFVNYVLGAERIDMAYSVEVRLPFLDHKLFEFARSDSSHSSTEERTAKIHPARSGKTICDRQRVPRSQTTVLRATGNAPVRQSAERTSPGYLAGAGFCRRPLFRSSRSHAFARQP